MEQPGDRKSYFTMVAIADAGPPVVVPPLVPATAAPQTRFTKAAARWSALRAAFAD